MPRIWIIPLEKDENTPNGSKIGSQPATTATITEAGEVYDLLILVELTIQSYIKSLDMSLPKILSIFSLAGSFACIRLLVYRNYCCRGKLIN
jgi:hypothetical protein